MTVLVTGGSGYIGSHTCLELLSSGFDVVAYDNLSNSTSEALRRVERLTGRPAPLIEGDIRDQAALQSVIERFRCTAVIHFAGLKAVGESIDEPLMYYDNNVGGTLSLLRAMSTTGLKRLIFSSSATVYGDPQSVPLDEQHPCSTTNPYGQTKLVIERVLFDLHRADPTWAITILRYFNPVGAHPSGQIGEDPKGTPNNLMPFVAQVAVGRRDALNIWGNDYETPDGTGIRDYIHVVDLARGHVKSLEKLTEPGCVPINLGTGRGYSVLEVVRAFERASGKQISHRFAQRRPGDIATCYANPDTAKRLLGWTAEKGLEEMCADQWKWQSHNPSGYVADNDVNTNQSKSERLAESSSPRSAHRGVEPVTLQRPAFPR